MENNKIVEQLLSEGNSLSQVCTLLCEAKRSADVRLKELRIRTFEDKLKKISESQEQAIKETMTTLAATLITTTGATSKCLLDGMKDGLIPVEGCTQCCE